MDGGGDEGAGEDGLLEGFVEGVFLLRGNGGGREGGKYGE